MNRLLTVPWLVVLWLMLWRDPSIANVASGIVIAVAVSLGLRLDWVGRRPRNHRLRPLAFAHFVAFFAWKLVEANLVVAREIVTPQNRIQTGIIAVPMVGYSDLVTTVVANAVSLTPGTLTVEIDDGTPNTLYIHVLHLHDIERARADVNALARRAAAALAHAGPSTSDREASTR